MRRLVEYFKKITGSDEAFPWDASETASKYVLEFAENNPCEPIILIAHSWGGNTAMKVAEELLKNKKCGCLQVYVVTLDPVSRYRKSSPEGLGGWINVAQKAGVEDYVFDIPLGIGMVLGGIWSGLGAVIGNDNMVASGGRQWNNVDGSNYYADASKTGHHDVEGMMGLTLKSSKYKNEIKDVSINGVPGKGMSVRDYVDALERKGDCCEK